MAVPEIALALCQQEGWCVGIGDVVELDECDEEPDDPEARERFARAR